MLVWNRTVTLSQYEGINTSCLLVAQGMKALRNQNIVHRDLKPGNILIKRHNKTGKMMVSLKH